MSEDNSRVVRCAIYTRKSSDEGLEQEYNSLDAQYDACRAYVSSQIHEGWVAVPDRFDDGGYSGGTLDRPALRNLLTRIDAGQIDMVVVYKIDRLTRSLSDFSKLVEQLGRAGCSFVSVTQSFNTSSSTGRLMLNVLLSFAQFERETTAERIRDKIAASKRKGIWMGGIPPLGYLVRERKLIVDRPEAKRVCQLFMLFQEHGCLNKTWRIATELGIRSRPTAKYPEGPPLRRSGILWILTNPIYAGQVRHRDNVYPGQHEAIIEKRVWANVQVLVAEYLASRRGKGPHLQRRSLLAGKIFDEGGTRLIPRFGGTVRYRHRYYVSAHRRSSASLTPNIWRVRAEMLETLVTTTVTKHIETTRLSDTGNCERRGRNGKNVKLNIPACEILGLVQSVHLRQGLIEIAIQTADLCRYLPSASHLAPNEVTRLSAPFQVRRASKELRLITGNRPPAVDQRLLTFVSQAAAWWQSILDGQSIAAIARQNGVSDRQITLRLPSAFLAPDLVEAIVEGRQPPSLSIEALRSGALPTDWTAQRLLFGVGQPS